MDHPVQDPGVEPRVSVYILAGGRSSRFGGDKARTLVEGAPLLAHVAGSLKAYAARLTVVASRAGRYADLGFRTIGDRERERGPMGGLHAALEDLPGAGWLLLASCDWLGLRPAWVGDLLAHRHPGARAVAFRSTLWEPLLALYHTDLRAEVAARLARGELALWRLIEESRHVAVPLPVDWSCAAQINRPHDLIGWSKQGGEG